MDKETIIKNFSRCAYTYDRYAKVQKCAALELLNLLAEDGIGKILEIGCGTGNYTLLLREKFSSSQIKAIDVSERMIEVASRKIKNKGVNFIVADAETINLNESFDLITSNACFQWFNDLDRAIIKYKNLLKTNGIILFSTFGPDTFCELNLCLEHIFGDMPLGASNFMGQKEIENILRDNFRKQEVKEDRYEEENSSLSDLLNKIKYTGIRGAGLNGKFSLTPGILKKLEDIYLRKFKHIKATYQVFFCKALRG